MSAPVPKTMDTIEDLVIATHNMGKASEIEALLKPYIQNFLTANDLDFPEPVEDGDTFEANALIKAISAAKHSGKLSLADDSGLCVVALNHEPGIYSARWAGPGKDFRAAMDKVEQELQRQSDRSAYFVCVLALAWPSGKTMTFRGEVHGTLRFPPAGDQGFGYDPIFVPHGHDITFAQMEPKDKHEISHRAHAFKKLMESQFWRQDNHA